MEKEDSNSTFKVQSTMSDPDAKQIIQAIATFLYSNITEDMIDGKVIQINSDMYYFSEEKYIAENPNDFEEDRITKIRKTPSKDEIAEFINAVTDSAKLSSKCIVGCMIYLNRITALSDIPLLPTTWRPLVFVSLKISSKLLDDKKILYSDFQNAYPFFNSDQYDILEIKFLNLIQNNTHINSSVYNKYCLELESFNPDEFPLKPFEVYNMGKNIK